MAIDLSALKEKKQAYIKEQAEKIAQYMVDKRLITDTLSTCDYSNWDIELHNNMTSICSELRKMGISSSSKVNHGVTDWVFTIINS